MGNLGKLALVLLLCKKLVNIESSLALKCRECSSYLHKKCEHKMNVCIAEDGESCRITRTWSPPNNVNNPSGGHSGCQKNCTTDEYDYSDIAILTNCCDKYDFCNDINIPLDEWY
ncbi:Pate7 [Phodopus roborovskii]|uniref:Pate7 protein n=1 Tax=Phodopus roborovskii TaxID=109678 RepID=A0AAU9ZTN5_PHORO|nr:Pate7 [Phodopus roborovskii]